MKRHVIYLWMILILALSPGIAGEEPKAGAGSERDLGRLRREVQRLKETYRTEFFGKVAETYVLKSITSEARRTPEMVDALIELCDIKRFPGTKNRFTPALLTPASVELLRLGFRARPQVESALRSDKLSLWQRAVLEEVLYELALVETRSKGEPPPRDYHARKLQRTDFEGVPPEKMEILLTNERQLLLPQPPFSPKTPAEITEPEPQPAAQPQAPSPAQTPPDASSRPQPQPQSQSDVSSRPQPHSGDKPAAGIRWDIAGAVAAAALIPTLIWIGIRKRRSRQASGEGG